MADGQIKNKGQMLASDYRSSKGIYHSHLLCCLKILVQLKYFSWPLNFKLTSVQLSISYCGKLYKKFYTYNVITQW